jgi:hypothetical protein
MKQDTQALEDQARRKQGIVSELGMEASVRGDLFRKETSIPKTENRIVNPVVKTPSLSAHSASLPCQEFFVPEMIKRTRPHISSLGYEREDSAPAQTSEDGFI